MKDLWAEFIAGFCKIPDIPFVCDAGAPNPLGWKVVIGLLGLFAVIVVVQVLMFIDAAIEGYRDDGKGDRKSESESDRAARKLEDARREEKARATLAKFALGRDDGKDKRRDDGTRRNKLWWLWPFVCDNIFLVIFVAIAIAAAIAWS